jgi:hypothetical protein
MPYNENYIQPEDTFHLVAEAPENLPRSESEACKTPQKQIATKTDKSNMSLLNFMFSYLQGLLIAADHPGGFLLHEGSCLVMHLSWDETLLGAEVPD